VFLPIRFVGITPRRIPDVQIPRIDRCTRERTCAATNECADKDTDRSAYQPDRCTGSSATRRATLGPFRLRCPTGTKQHYEGKRGNSLHIRLPDSLVAS
jgi:hypothetical protein